MQIQPDPQQQSDPRKRERERNQPPAAAHQKYQQRPEQIKLLFHRQRPEMVQIRPNAWVEIRDREPDAGVLQIGKQYILPPIPGKMHSDPNAPESAERKETRNREEKCAEIAAYKNCENNADHAACHTGYR